MRILLAIAALAVAAPVTGCISEATQRDGGLATYDAIKAAQKACEAKGRVFKLRRNGDAQYLDDYACEKKKD
jgi:hypothetical protein